MLKPCRRSFVLPMAVLLLVMSALSCAPRLRPPSNRIIHRERGVASWYGGKFHGRKTANGERYNMHGISAAHKTLPLGSYARVRHLENGRSVIVRINDRGPFVKGRIIDLSYGAARRLGMVKEGVADVVIEVFDGGPSLPSTSVPPSYAIQAGSFLQRENAVNLVGRLGGRYRPVTIVSFRDGRDTYYRVLAGHFYSKSGAERASSALTAEGIENFVVRRD